MAVNFEIGQGYSIPKDAQVKVKEYTNDVKTVTYVSNKSNNLRRYKRINNKEYIDKKTGEILQYNVQEVKTEKSLKRTLNGPLADLLINNFTGGNNQIFVTLTFEWDMNDFNKLKWYFDRFWSRLCYKYKSCNLACIYVKEKHSSNKSWHIHAVIKDNNHKYLFIDNSEMNKIWKYGFTKVSRIKKGMISYGKEINEEKALESSLFISNDKFDSNKVASYMCKLKTKENNIPARGRVYGYKGKLLKPIEYNQRARDCQYGYLIAEQTVLVKNADTNSIVNRIHKQWWLDR